MKVSRQSNGLVMSSVSGRNKMRCYAYNLKLWRRQYVKEEQNCKSNWLCLIAYLAYHHGMVTHRDHSYPGHRHNLESEDRRKVKVALIVVLAHLLWALGQNDDAAQEALRDENFFLSVKI